MKGRACVAAFAAAVLAACTPAQSAAAPTVAATATAVVSATPAPTATPRPSPHVFVIVMENTGLDRALASASIGALAQRYALFTDYHAVSRPSLPNYLAMTSGSTWGISDDGYHALPATGLGAQLTAAGISWRAYMEGMTAAGCMRSPYPYALKHDPFAYYGGACPANVVPFEDLAADLSAPTPSFVWITPGLCHDAHDCPIDEAGAWLDDQVARIVSSQAWNERSALFVAFDEGDGNDANLVPLIAATGRGLRGRIATPYDHYALLATIEDAFGLPRLGAAAQAKPIAEVLAALE
jgi:phospholipase C